MVRAATLVALLSATSCVSSSSNVCEDGSTCPGGFVCDVDNSRCLLPEQIAECEGLPADESCTFDGAPGACRDGACIPFFCGDGFVTPGEECDGEDLKEKTCKEFGFYQTAGLACSSSCTFALGNNGDDGLERSGCFVHEYCGDDTVNGPELCDGPQDRTCVSIGFDAGTTSCNLQCGFTIGDCSRFGWNPESLSEVLALAIAATAHDDNWAFGSNGRAMRFQGAFWFSVPTGVTNELVNAWAFTPSDAWAVGQSDTGLASVLIHWNGTQWAPVSNVPAGEYLDVWGPAANEVYVASSTGIHRFNGVSWSTLAGFSGAPKTIRGTSGSDIWVATTGGPLMHYNGSAWTDRTPPIPSTATTATIQFLDANRLDDVWAIGFQSGSGNEGNGVIAHYTGTWQVWRTAQETYNAVAGSAPNDAWVAGVDGIMRHWDGVAWSSSANIGSSPTGLTAISGLISLGPNEVVGVSTLHLAYRYRGQAFGTFKPLGTNPFDAPENLTIWSNSAADVYVGNVKGELWHFDGINWALDFTVPGGAKINDIWAGNGLSMWFVADDGNAYRYNGSTWIPFAVTGVPLTHVWVDTTTSDNVWVFGNGGAYHKEDVVWAYTPFTTGRVASVSGSGPDNVWAVQVGPSSVWKYNGTTWAQFATGATSPELAVAAVGVDDVHVTAEGGRFEHFNGTAWTESMLPVLADLRFVAYTADDDVVAASERDLAHFNGTSWSTLRTPIDFVPNTANYLPIVDLVVSPGRIDMLLQTFRVRTLIRTRPLICRNDEICGDSVDNDCDNLLDALDVTECP